VHPGVFAAKEPERPAVIMGAAGTVVTYAELEARSNQVAWLARRGGLRPGDGLAAIMENRPELLNLAWGAQRSGLQFTAVNWHLTADEAGYVVTDSGARMVVISRQLAGLAAQHPDIPGHWLRELLGMAEGDVYLSPAPLYHAAPLAWTMSCHRTGATVVVMERFEAEQALRLIEAHRVTHSQWVPTMFVRLLKLPPVRPGRIRPEQPALGGARRGALPGTTATRVRRPPRPTSAAGGAAGRLLPHAPGRVQVPALVRVHHGGTADAGGQDPAWPAARAIRRGPGPVPPADRAVFMIAKTLVSHAVLNSSRS